MKLNIITSILFLGCMIMACGEEQPIPATSETRHEIEIRFPGIKIPTKAPLAQDETDAEAVVHSIQLLVYNSSGILESYHTLKSSSGTISVRSGSKTLIAVANCNKNLSTCNSKDSLYATATVLSDNILSNPCSFVMSGETSVEVNGDTQASITLERIAAKFLIRKISYKLGVAFASSDITINRVYIDNAVVNANLGGSKPNLTENDFINKRGGFDNEGIYQPWASSLYDDWTMWQPQASELALGQKLYSYPNATAEKDDDRSKTGTFTVRKTRLVVEATLKGRKTFYPYTFDGPIEKNKYYEITELTITGYGVDHPEDIIPDKTVVSVNVVVKTWELGGTSSIEI